MLRCTEVSQLANVMGHFRPSQRTLPPGPRARQVL